MKSKIIFGITFIFCGIIGFYYTTKNTAAVANAAIGEEQLVRILADVHEGETLINTITDYTQRDSAAQAIYSKILKINKTTMAAVDTSLAVYINEPARGQALYEKVQNRISMDASQ